jgi:ATP-dependent DNA helicase RecG
MSRLLQGDVGSGKTVVALAATMINADRLRQTVLLAPTEVLAQQHYATCERLLPQGFTTLLLTGSTKKAARNKILAELASGTAHLIIGTHALLNEEVRFNNLGLVIIDEQHRFGVEQRAAMHRKGNNPDLLVMTATPIPRSLTLALFGDLELSIMNEKPANRKPVKTMLFSDNRLEAVCKSVRKYCTQGRQAFFVLPMIEDTEQQDLRSATSLYKELSGTYLSGLRIGLLHGRQKAAEKQTVLENFASGNIDVLVSTTVIEVGIDVPNASIMIIMHAERFGLSQLHQLRGRVGRGDHESFCVLMYPEHAQPASIERLTQLCVLDNGFEIAEADLRFRGGGDFFGTRQHGLADFLAYTDLAADADLVLQARTAAQEYAAGHENVSSQHIDTLRQSLSNLRHSSLLSIITLIIPFRQQILAMKSVLRVIRAVTKTLTIFRSCPLWARKYR